MSATGLAKARRARRRAIAHAADKVTAPVETNSTEAV